jgi:hypothetical protein
MHFKNHNSLLNYNNITFFETDDINIINNIDLSQFDCVYSPSMPINVNKFPNTKFIFGPHFDIFPNKEQMDKIRGEKTIYIQPSEWVCTLWKNSPYCDNIKILPLAFGVDTKKFNNIKPINEREKVFIYFKSRHPFLLIIMQNFLNEKKINYKIFNYDTKYDENEYINYLMESKYGIWIGRHESQGFALEEALSCNVPLLVWNIKSMKEMYGYVCDDIPATSIPYWDERCGEIFTDINELNNKMNIFISNIESYKPREYILENLSFDICEKKLIDIINNI